MGQEEQQTAQVAEAEGSEEEPPMAVQPFKFYLKPEITYKIMSTNWQPYTFIAFFGWFYELCWTIAGVNNYTDITRGFNCSTGQLETDPAKIALASSNLDAAIAICTIWHMLEWIRWTLLWTTSLVNANLVPPFYLLTVTNVPLGFILALYGFITSFTANAGCSKHQLERHRYLTLQILCFVLYFVISMAPFIFYKIQGVEKLHADFLKEDDDDEDD